MSILLKQPLPLLTDSLLPQRTKASENVIAGHNRLVREGSFASLLTDALRDAGRTAGATNQYVPLPKEMVRELLLKMKESLDLQLLRLAVAKGEEASMGPVSLSLRDGSSKNRQTLQKIDGPASPDDLDSIITQASQAYGVDRALIYSVIKAESSFVNGSTSPKGARGLMQLMPDTARELGVKNSFDPRENIMGGTRYLKGLLDRYQGNVALALAAYNWGMGNLERNPERIPAETRNYVSRIVRYYQEAKS